MAIERTILFHGGEAYDINKTIEKLQICRDNAIEMEAYVAVGVLDNCIITMMNCKFHTYIDYEMFIPDIDSGLYIGLAEWLKRFGMPDNFLEVYYEDSSVCTYETEELTVIDDKEECISDEDEEEMVIGAQLLLEMHNEAGLLVRRDGLDSE